jgi:hypothetical protein
MPKQVFTTEDIQSLHSKLHGEVKEHTPPESEHAMPIHGFLPPVKQPTTKAIRARMDALQKNLVQQDGRYTAGQRDELQEISVQARAMLRETKITATAHKDVHRAVIYELRSAYRNIYNSVHELIRTTESDSLTELDLYVANTVIQAARPQQTAQDLCTLFSNAFQTKRDLYDPYFTVMANGDSRIKFLEASLKGPWRCVEKMELRKEPVDSCSSICDVVRGAMCAGSIAALTSVYKQMMEDTERVRILRVKNRLKEANDSGWADCLINFVFVEDPSQHVCEVQLVHTKLMLVRQNMGAHSSYAFFRTANELLEATDSTGHWQEETALVELHTRCNGAQWTRQAGWNTSAPVGSWENVTVNDQGHVVTLDLTNNNLEGQSIHQVT